MDKLVLFKNDLIYTSCYCEENIWKLIEYLFEKNSDNLNLESELFAVFISNESRTIPVWYQSSSDDTEIPVVWDYHVICIHKTNQKCQIYDFDTILNFPEGFLILFKIIVSPFLSKIFFQDFKTYLDKALIELPNIKKQYKRSYKVIPAKYYLKNFSSDRSHMINKSTGEYMKSPPNYPNIQSNNSKNNIQEFIDMKNLQHGTVMTHVQFAQFFN